jgi:hypothetical protein
MFYLDNRGFYYWRMLRPCGKRSGLRTEFTTKLDRVSEGADKNLAGPQVSIYLPRRYDGLPDTTVVNHFDREDSRARI